MQVLENGRICTSLKHVEELYIKSNTHHFACKFHLEGVEIYKYIIFYFIIYIYFYFYFPTQPGSFFYPPSFQPASIIYYVNNVGTTLDLLHFVGQWPPQHKKR